MERIETKEDILFLASIWQKSKVLFTAIELNVFFYLSDFISSETLASRLNLSPRHIDRLLKALASMGLLEKKGNLFKNSVLAEKFLNPESEGYLKNLRHGAHVYHYWNFLPLVVKKGVPAVDLPEVPKVDNWVEDFISAMDFYSEEKSPYLSGLLKLKEGEKFLDLGGGSGALAVEVAKRFPRASVYVFDLPNVIELAKRFVSEKGDFDNIFFLTGDYLKDDFGDKYNAVFLSNILHMHGDEEIKVILDKCFKALNKNGTIYIHDYFLNKDEVSPQRTVFFAINMLVHTKTGDCFTFEKIKELSESCGFSGFEIIETPFQSHVFIAKK